MQPGVREGVQGGEVRRKEPSIILKAHGQGSPWFGLDCTAQEPKRNWKAKRGSSNTKATPCVQPGGWRKRAQPGGGTGPRPKSIVENIKKIKLKKKKV